MQHACGTERRGVREELRAELLAAEGGCQTIYGMIRRSRKDKLGRHTIYFGQDLRKAKAKLMHRGVVFVAVGS